MIDTHTHLYLEDSFDDGGEGSVRRAIEAGVDRMILPNIDRESAAPLIALHKKFPEATFIAAGLHPTEVGKGWKNELEEILEKFQEFPLVGIGEIGLDLYWDKSELVAQMDAFGTQLELAHERGLPAIVHSRSADRETLEVLRMMGDRRPRMVFHSFTYGPGVAESILSEAEDSMFGFNGVITFKNAAEVRESARLVGLERIVAETDSPYLAPVPHRGKRNESAYLPYVIGGIAFATDSTEEVAREATTRNAEQLFKI